MTANQTQGQTEDKNTLILKGRFKSNSLNLYGIFLIIFNPSQDIESSNIIVSTFSSVYDLEPHTGWERYEEYILEMKWKGNYNTSMSSSLMDQLKKLSVEEQLKKQIFEYVDNYDYDHVDTFLFDIINRIIHDKNLILETGIQELTRDEFREAKEKKIKGGEADTKEKKELMVEEGSVILPLQPILSPVKGKPIYELKIGDKIMMKITPSSDRANYFIDLMNLRIENNIKPVACEVIDIKVEGKNSPVEILTQIGPGIYGKCREEERQVKLRLYDPVIDGPLSKKGLGAKGMAAGEPSPVDQERSFSKMSYIIMGLFAVILIIFILLIYVSF